MVPPWLFSQIPLLTISTSPSSYLHSRWHLAFSSSSVQTDADKQDSPHNPSANQRGSFASVTSPGKIQSFSPYKNWACEQPPSHMLCMGIIKDPGAVIFFVLFPHTPAPAAETTSGTRDLPHQTHCLLATASAPKTALWLLSTSLASVLMGAGGTPVIFVITVISNCDLFIQAGKALSVFSANLSMVFSLIEQFHIWVKPT